MLIEFCGILNKFKSTSEICMAISDDKKASGGLWDAQGPKKRNRRRGRWLPDFVDRCNLATDSGRVCFGGLSQKSLKVLCFYLILAIHPAIAPRILTGARIQKAVCQPPPD